MCSESEHLRYLWCYEYSDHDDDDTDHGIADRVDSGLHFFIFTSREYEHESSPDNEENRAKSCYKDNE